MKAAIVVVGNELLSGHTQDANGPFLVGELRARGHRVQELTIVRDDERQIVHALEQGSGLAALVFVCGGLGPTMDDRTIEAVAAFLERDLHTPEAAKEQVRRIYRLGKEHGYLATDEVDEEAWRMARVPEGGVVVANGEGVAPGSVHTFERDGTTHTLYVLPGPPGELQSVWDNLVDQGLLPGGDVEHVDEVHFRTFEAPVSKALRAIQDAFPTVELGSYPQRDEKRVIVRVTGDEKGVAEAIAALRERLGELEIQRR